MRTVGLPQDRQPQAVPGQPELRRDDPSASLRRVVAEQSRRSPQPDSPCPNGALTSPTNPVIAQIQLGILLRELRDAAGLTLAEVAPHLGMTGATLSKV
ncbi:MAG: helix-turn-helix domain-containing protein [Actinophytocola sp.]|nr:helix-turn-helix domain-containing protein [Actinophytocola sp.]